MKKKSPSSRSARQSYEQTYVPGSVHLFALPCPALYADEYIYTSAALVFPNAGSKTDPVRKLRALGERHEGCAWELVVWSRLDR